MPALAILTFLLCSIILFSSTLFLFSSSENGQIKPTVTEAAMKRDETILATTAQADAIAETHKETVQTKSGKKQQKNSLSTTTIWMPENLLE